MQLHAFYLSDLTRPVVGDATAALLGRASYHPGFAVIALAPVTWDGGQKGKGEGLLDMKLRGSFGRASCCTGNRRLCDVSATKDVNRVVRYASEQCAMRARTCILLICPTDLPSGAPGQEVTGHESRSMGQRPKNAPKSSCHGNHHLHQHCCWGRARTPMCVIGMPGPPFAGADVKKFFGCSVQ